MGNVVTAIVMMLIGPVGVVDVIDVSFLPALFLYAFSLDAIVSTSRLGKGAVLSAMLSICLWVLIAYHIHSDQVKG